MSIQIKNLLNWNNQAARAMNSTPFWMNLVRTFGAELLYFLIDKEYANQIPETMDALKKFKTQIVEWNGRKPKHGSVWILFAFKENLADLPAPFRKDGILLPFEWRTGDEVTQHSSLLPQGLTELADKVKQQFGEKAEKYYLYPDSIFQDRVDFSMDGVGFSSGWGALVSGLYLALNPKAMLLEWPFSSIQFNFEKGEMDAVTASIGISDIKVGYVDTRGGDDKRFCPLLKIVRAEDGALAAFNCSRIGITVNISRDSG